MIVSHSAFLIFCSTVILATVLGRLIIEVVRMRRDLRREVERDAGWRDRIFGYVMGLVIAGIGLAGVLKYYFYPA